MSKYRVDIQETREFSFDVEADDVEQAEQKASELFDEDAENNAIHVEAFDKTITNSEPIP